MAVLTFKAGSSWFAPNITTIKRNTITAINIVDSYVATGNETDSWDASEDNDGSVMCYVSGTVLTIAGNGSGTIKFNADQSYWLYTADGKDYFKICTSFTGLSLIDTSNCTTLNRAFRGLEKITSLDIGHFDISNVKSLYQTFCYCKKLTSLPIENWDVSNVTDMAYTFYNTGALALPIENWNVSNVTNLDHTFAHSTSLNNLDLTKWDVSNVINMNATFCGMKALTSLDLSTWDTSKVTCFPQFFEGCSNLEVIYGLENFDTSKSVCFAQMFRGCSKLKELDLSSFDTRNGDSGSITSDNGSTSACTWQMITNTHKLEKITLGKYFTFEGKGADIVPAEDIGTLPAPSATYIAEADGNWYTEDFTTYAPADVPNLTEMTYYASKKVVNDVIDKRVLDYKGLKYVLESLNTVINTDLENKADKEHTHNAEDIIGLDIGGGSAVQNDWEQTDPTANDYIKNKPFFDNGTEKEVIYDADITLYDAGDLENGANVNNMYGLSNNFLFAWPSNLPTFIEGQTYEIEFDNKTYNLLCQKGPTAKDDSNTITEELFLGNYFEFSNRTVETFDYTNAPFLIINEKNSSLWAFGEELRKKVNDQMVFHLKISTSPISMIRDKYLKKEFFAGRAGLGKNSEVFNNLEVFSAFGESSHAEGSSDPITLSITADTTIEHIPVRSSDFAMAAGKASHVEGHNSLARGDYSHAEGLETTAYANGSHAEGVNTEASGYASHAEGTHTEATGEGSHAGGSGSQATGWTSFAHGFNTVASGEHSTALGAGTTAAGQMQLAIGCCNEVDETSLLVAGWGESTNKKTVYKLSRSGAAWHKGDIQTEEDIWAGGNIYAKGTKQVATIEDVEETLTTVNQNLAGKVDKVDGKDLSTNDFTNELKTQLENLVAAGESAQSDFEINDESNPSFIKNRPVYHILTEVWYPVTDISVNNNNPGFSCGVSTGAEVIQKITEAGECDVFYNGVKYYTTVKDGSILEFPNATFIGNAQVYAQLDGKTLPDSYDTGEPFMALILDEGLLFADPTSLATEITIGINKAEIIKKLDEKYLPDNAATKDYVEQALSSINIGEKTEKQVIFQESSLTFAADEDLGGLYANGVHEPSLVFPMIEGNTYYVNWDGVEYECVAVSGSLAGLNGVAVGNTGAVGIGEVSNEPFIVGYVPNNNVNALISFDTQSTHTVSVSEIVVIPSSVEVEWDNVKNKPFCESTATETIIFEDKSFIIADHASEDTIFLNNDATENKVFNKNNIYTITFDSSTYENLPVASFLGMDVMGSSKIIRNEFGISDYPQNDCPVIVAEAPASMFTGEEGYLLVMMLATDNLDIDINNPINVQIVEIKKTFSLIGPEWIKDMYGESENILWKSQFIDTWNPDGNGSGSWNGSNEIVAMSCPNIVPGNYYTLTFNGEKFDNIECIEEAVFDVTSLYVLKTPKFDLKVDHNGEAIGAPLTILTLINPLPPENPNISQNMTYIVKIETAPTIIQIKERYIPILEENNSGYTIKPEYMPTEIATTSIILNSSTPGSTKKFRITIDDDGILSAEEVTN